MLGTMHMFDIVVVGVTVVVALTMVEIMLLV